MSLASVLQTARSGTSAASARVDAVSQNMANSRTNGYRAVRPVLATQMPSTRSGGNATQTGTGVRVAGIVTDDSQGSLIVAALDDQTLVEEEAWTDDVEGLLEEGLVELSNTDAGEELVELILASEQFSANANVFDTADDLLDDLIHLGRNRW